MAAGIAWTRGVVDQAGMIASLEALPARLHLRLASGTTVLGVHASPLADDGPGIDPGIADDQLLPLLAGHGADVIIGGHTHLITDRLVPDALDRDDHITRTSRNCEPALSAWEDYGSGHVTPC
jgi:hypothetical protein